MPGEAGRPTDLTEAVFRQIERAVLEGKNLKEIASITEIPVTTLYTWSSDNYLNLRDKIEVWKLDRKLMLANKNIAKFLTMSSKNTGVTKKGDIFEFNDPRLLKIKADASFFVAETLGKKNYSKRSELTGADGKDLQPVLVKFIDSDDKDNPDTSGIQKAV